MSAPTNPNDFKAVIADPSQSLCGNFVNTILKLPVLLYKLVNWMLNTDGSATTDAITTFSPVGAGDLIFSASPVSPTRIDQSTGPTNGAFDRLLCDGRTISRAQYPGLYLAIGDTYGAGDNVSTFAIPNLKDMFPVGAGNLYPLGSTAGAVSTVLTIPQMPPHTHQVGTGSGPGEVDAKGHLINTGDGAISNILTASGGSLATKPTGGNGTNDAGGNPTSAPVPTLPPYVACYIYIKT